MTESPYTALPVADGTNAVAPLKWRVGRTVAVGFSVGGAASALAGHIAGLMPLQTAGGECFGGGLLVFSGLILCILLWSQRKRLAVDFRLWGIASTSLILLGTLFLASSFTKVYKDRSDRREVFENLKALQSAMDAVQQPSTDPDH